MKFPGTTAASCVVHHALSVQGTDQAGFLIDYGSGIVAGSVAFDTVRVGEPTVKIQRQGIGLADATTNAFTSASCDGLFVSFLSFRPSIFITQCDCAQRL